MADIDTAFMQQIFDISEREWKPDVHHHSKADDLRTGSEVPKGITFRHPPRLGDRPARLKPDRSDNALLSNRLYDAAYGAFSLITRPLSAEGSGGSS